MTLIWSDPLARMVFLTAALRLALDLPASLTVSTVKDLQLSARAMQTNFDLCSSALKECTW